MSSEPTLTDELIAPGEVAATTWLDEGRRAFATDLASLSAARPAWPEMVVTLPALRRATSAGRSPFADDGPFRWKPAFVRRSLGLAAIASCVEGRFHTPAEAVGPVAEQAVVDWQRSGWRTYHWEPWMSYLPDGARAVVLAEATRWASGLWCALDWRVLRSLVRIEERDVQWRVPPSGVVRLRGRCDLRVAVAGRSAGRGQRQRGRTDRSDGSPTATDPSGEALVVTSAGLPPTSWELDLAFPVLVGALARPRRPLPVRVLGIWPDGSEHRTAEVDADLLVRAQRRVLAGVAAMLGGGPADLQRSAPLPSRSRARAAAPSGLPAAVSGISSTTSSWRGIL